MQKPMIPHRGEGMKAIYRSILDRAKIAHGTSGDIFIWPASGSAGWEVAAVNLFSPGDTVICAIGGDFGERFHRSTKALGLNVERLDVEWGQALTPEALRAKLEATPDARGVFLVHNETSTGVTHPIEQLAAVVREFDALVVVDAVSSAAGIEIKMDLWGIDYVMSGSQKAWMCPPGLLITAVGERCWPAFERSTYKRFFWNFGAMREAAMEGATPTTPPLSLLYAFDAALDLILTEGLEQVYARHTALGAQMRAGVLGLGMTLFADPAYASNTVTAVNVPGGKGAKELIRRLKEEHGIDVAAGQAHTGDSIIRVGHMGWCDSEDIEIVLDALAEIVPTLKSA
jgi:aspartate aminotransferase-like enzyme